MVKYTSKIKTKIKCICVFPVVAQWVKNLTSIHEVAGLIPGLSQLLKDLALLQGHRCASDLALLWPLHRPAAATPI